MDNKDDGYFKLKLRAADHVFDSMLTEGLIIERPNRFLMNVEVNGKTEVAHCPNTGKIGSVKFHNIPALLSFHDSPNRKLRWTVEAISYDRPDKKHKTWIGINTTATNRYIRTFLEHGMFPDMVDIRVPTAVKREQKLGDSRIDFRVGDTFIEVKTWTQIIEKVVPDWVEQREVKERSYSGSNRLVKHATELTNALKSHQRCIMLGCYQYVPDEDDGLDRYDYGQLYKDSDIIRKAFDGAHDAGVESWTCTMDINPERVKLVNYWKE